MNGKDITMFDVLLESTHKQAETIAALHARIAELEEGLERSKKIMETIYTVSSKAGIRPKQIECPHGIIPSFPSHAWWCDKCFEELQNTIWELEDLQKAQS